MKLSALILTNNEQEMIGDCLKQLDFVDEIILLDQFSQDNTEQIAQQYGAKVLKTREKDFDKNRNLLLAESKGEWVIYLDADERLSSETIAEIKNAILKNDKNAYCIPRKNIILGKYLRHGGWWPDFVPRLFKRKSLIKWVGKVHESPQIQGSFSHFKHPIEHITGRSMYSMLEKSRKWAKIEAELYFQTNNMKVSQLKVVKTILFEFIKRYFFKLGFLDGFVGMVEALFQGLHHAMVLTYLWELQNKNNEKFKEINIE